MRLLLDTHAFLWWLQDSRQLGRRARAAIATPESTVHVSAASLWEIAIKESLGRLRTGGIDLAAEIEANDFVELRISARHAQDAGRLPGHHRDPFDRMLVAQARAEGLMCVSRDPALRLYEVPILW